MFSVSTITPLHFEGDVAIHQYFGQDTLTVVAML